MTTGLIVLISLIAALTLIALRFTGIYNNLVHLKALLQEAWSGIDVQLKRRNDLIPNLVETVRGYSIHEKEIFENVAKMRSASMHATGVEQKAAAEAGLTQALKSLFAVVENYPELKANQNFLRLQEDLGHIEDDLQLARRYYNGTARNYNIIVQRFPSNIIASITGFSLEPYFEVTAAHERETPQVKF